MSGTRCAAPRTCCTGSGSARRSRRTGPRSGTRTRSPRGGRRPGRRCEASGGERGVDLLRGRGRAEPAAAEGPHLGPPRAHPRGQRAGKGSGRVSVAGLVCLRPDARSHLFYRVRIHRGRKGERRSMSEADYAGLITAAHQQLHAPVILIWDNLNTHISAAMRAFTSAHPDWLTEVRLPGYAPDLNPAEGVWANMKNGLGNLMARDVDQLATII